MKKKARNRQKVPIHSIQHKDLFLQKGKGQNNISCFQEGIKALHRGRNCFWINTISQASLQLVREKSSMQNGKQGHSAYDDVG